MTTTAMAPKFSARSYDFVEYVPCKNWIGGQWRDATTGKTIPVENPRWGKPLSNVPISGAEDVALAADVAVKAQKAWRDVPMKERAQVFFRLKTLMERDLEELAWLVTHENGKSIDDLPVVDTQDRPIGLIDVQDIVAIKIVG